MVVGGAAAGRPREGLFATLLIALVFAAQWVLVADTNFWGFDEWLHIDLIGRGVLGFPHANRPLTLLWSTPVKLYDVEYLASYAALQGAYLAVSGCCVYWLCRSTGVPEPVALVGGVLTAIWAPNDLLRIMSVGVMTYAGSMCASLGALALLQASWVRHSAVLLGLAALLAFTAGRTFEGVLPLLFVVGGLVLWRGRGREAWVWRSVWAGACLAAGGLVLVGLLSAEATAYQAALAFDPNPVAVAGRLTHQLWAHYGAAVFRGVAPGDFADLRVWPGALLVLGWGAWRWRRPPATPEGGRAALARLAGLGLGAALLAYLPIVLSATVQSSSRTQFLSSAGVGVSLAALAGLVASAAPERWRLAAFVALASLLVGVSAVRTLKLQQVWDQASRYPGQQVTIEQLVRIAPALEPGTLLLLVRGAQAWPGSFTFRHAVDHLYERQATGLVWDAIQPLYPASSDDSGIAISSLPALRGPWDAAPTHHTAAETVVLDLDPAGVLRVLDEWPSEALGSSGEGYRPWRRIRLTGGAGRRILR